MSQKSKRVLKVFSTNFIEILCLATLLFSVVVLGFCLRNSINLRELLANVDKSETTGKVSFMPSFETRNYKGHLGERKKQCQPLPPRDNCFERYDRISDSMCCEYIWEMNHKDAILKYNSECSARRFYVIGGRNSLPGEFPHMAALGWELKAHEMSGTDSPLRKYEFLCGGSLISNRFVVTAGHCTYASKHQRFKSAKPVMVRLGTENIGYENYRMNKNIQDKKIDRIFKHRNYKPPKHYYDIALLKLTSEVIFSKTIHPACISTLFLTSTSPTVNVTGWGVTNVASDKTSDLLQVATLDIISHKRCENEYIRHSYRHFKNLEEHQFCAAHYSGRIDTCQGDSGGPIQKRIETTSGLMHTVLGVTSMGYKCARASGIYINITSEEIITWIESIVWDEDFPGFRQ